MLPKRDFLGTQAQPLGIRSQCPPPPQPCGKTIIANFAFWRWHHTVENILSIAARIHHAVAAQIVRLTYGIKRPAGK